MFRNFKVLLIAVFVLAIAGSAYAFAAANTVSASTAGSGGSTVSGYTVSNILYDLDGTDPSLVDAITFTVAPLSGTEKAVAVFVQTTDLGVWTSCPVTGVGPSVNATCTFGALTLASVTELNVVANSTTDPVP